MLIYSWKPGSVLAKLLKNTTGHYMSTSQLLQIDISDVLEQFRLVAAMVYHP